MTTRTKAFFWILAVFMIGTIFGGSLGYLFLNPADAPQADFQPRQVDSKAKDEKKHRSGFFQALVAAVDADDSQRAELKEVLENNRDEYKRVRKEKEARLQEIRIRIREQLRATLRPDQVEKFDQFIASHRH